MKKLIRGLFRSLIGLYIFSLIIFIPYFNWQYAKDHGFLKWFFFGEIVATAKAAVWPYYIFVADGKPYTQAESEGEIAEYTDNEYGYTFQFPADWKMAPVPAKGEAGEVRVVIKSPQSTMLMVTVSKLESTISKKAFLGNPNSNAIVDAMINLTIESAYKKASRDIGATRMIVRERRAVPSDVAIKFFVTTMHFIKNDRSELPMVVSGLHYMPFGKDHMISFIMIGPVDPKAKEDNEIFTKVFNSFHLAGESPL